jgi:hypothetical protein
MLARYNHFRIKQNDLGRTSMASKMSPKMIAICTAALGIVYSAGYMTTLTCKPCKTKHSQANPELAGIFATEANGGVGVGNAIKSLGKLSQVKIISFDTDKGTLDMVRDGVISATLAQGTWNMGYWSLQHLFHIHHDLAQPIADWKEGNVPLLPTNVDTGISVVTQTNVANYYAK